LNVLFGGSDHRFFRFELVLIELLQQSGHERHMPAVVWHPGSSEQFATFWREAELAVDVLDDAEVDEQLTELQS